MRHRKLSRRFDRDPEHRTAMFENLTTSLLKYEKITTTLPKAKELRKYVEKIITLGKKNTVHARRMVFKTIREKLVLQKLFSEIAPRYLERNGGYTRIIKTNLRKGDGAQLSVIQLVEKEIKTKNSKTSNQDIINKEVPEASADKISVVKSPETNV